MLQKPRIERFILVCLVAMVFFAPITLNCSVATAMPQSGGGIGGDLNGDDVDDDANALPGGDSDDPSPGRIEFENGATGEIIVTFSGTTDDDLFGYSYAIAPDMNSDGLREVIVGAPGDGSGRAYLFLTPFPENDVEITSDSAAMVFESSLESDFEFGSQVGGFYDFDGDGVREFRIGSYALDNDGQVVSVLQIISGTTGQTIAVTRHGIAEMAWDSLAGDLDGDADVDFEDLDLILSWMHDSSQQAIDVADVNGDGLVDANDFVDAITNFGNWSGRVAAAYPTHPPSENCCICIWDTALDTFTLYCNGVERDCPDCACSEFDCSDFIGGGDGGDGGGDDGIGGNGGDTGNDSGDHDCTIRKEDGGGPSGCVGSIVCLQLPEGDQGCVYSYSIGGSAEICVLPGGSQECPSDGDEVELSPANSCILLLSPGTVVVTATPDLSGDCDCTAGDQFTLYSIRVDIRIDSNNNFRIDDGDEPIEFDDGTLGKIIGVNRHDFDDDGIPAWADGMGRILDNTDSIEDEHSAFEIAHIDIEGFPAGSTINAVVHYSESDPSLVDAVDRECWRAEEPPSGSMRVWTLPGWEPRNWAPLESDGDFVKTGHIFDVEESFGSTNFQIFIEGMNGSDAVGADSIRIDVFGETPDGEILGACTDEVRLTVVELETLDLRHWGPNFDPIDETISLDTTGVYAIDDDVASVGGAITDGASICLIRTNPQISFADHGLSAGIRVTKAGDFDFPCPGFDCSVQSMYWGSLKPLALIDGSSEPEIDDSQFPLLPHDFEKKPNHDSVWIHELELGCCYYIPPEAYADDNFSDSDYALHSGEMQSMYFSLVLTYDADGGGTFATPIADEPFALRRPPQILAHGILSDTSTWSTWIAEWRNDYSGEETHSRIYAVDYSATAHLGYSENYGALAFEIERALREYRNGEDVPSTYNEDYDELRFCGVKYAATRADVIGHSQGGQISRYYIADVQCPEWFYPRTDIFYTPAIAARTDTPPAELPDTWSIDLPPHNDFFQSSAAPPSAEELSRSGRWHYLRSDNWGAGSIRRLITLGSPFKGSPLAAYSSGLFAATNSNFFRIKDAVDNGVISIDGLGGLFFPPLDGPGTRVALNNYYPPTCLDDLREDGLAHYVLACETGLDPDQQWYFGPNVKSEYPRLNRGVPLFMMAGVFGANHDATYTLGDLITDGVILLPYLRAIFGINEADANDDEPGSLLTMNWIAWTGRLDEDITDYSDLIVPLTSQIDGQFASNTAVYFRHTHSNIPLLTDEIGRYDEPGSPAMRPHANQLLSAFRINNTLSAWPGDSSVIDEQVGRRFYPIGFSSDSPCSSN